MTYFLVFFYLQVLDFLTTLVGLKTGAAEASPVIRMLMHFGPAAGLALSKLIAFGLAGLCIWLNKRHLIRRISYWYAGLVVWNLCIILTARAIG
ncbi:MAG TPA: DUF5658 family protein [Bryobacteraceae bacterium]|nr:DUF5658 family protein [Bryobacteraceae bacterium]